MKNNLELALIDDLASSWPAQAWLKGQLRHHSASKPAVIHVPLLSLTPDTKSVTKLWQFRPPK